MQFITDVIMPSMQRTVVALLDMKSANANRNSFYSTILKPKSALLTRSYIEWDKGNSTKSLVKHKVTTQEVEEVFLGKLVVPLGKRIEPQDSEDRYGIIGPTWHERLLMIVFTFRN